MDGPGGGSSFRSERRSRRRHRLALAVTGVLACSTAAFGGVAAAATGTAVGCSVPALVAALDAANATPGADTLNLAAGCTYTLTGPDNANNGLPVVTGTIVVNGRGATIRRDPAADGAFRILAVAATGDLTLDGVTISGGRVTGTDCPAFPGEFACGGGIANSGSLSVRNSRVVDNTVTSTVYAEGGAIDTFGVAAITATELRGNTSIYDGHGVGAATGGGIANNATMTLDAALVTRNTAVDNSGAGPANLAEGAGVENFGTATVVNSTVTDNVNRADHDTAHGSLINQGTMTVRSTSVIGNLAVAAGGQVAAAGIGSGPFSNLTLIAGLVTHNAASAPGGLARAGGLGTRDAHVRVSDSLFADNSASAPGGSALGGGINGEGAAVSISRSTVVGNTATGTVARGGGLYNTATSTGPGIMSVADSSVLDNRATGPSAAGGGVFDANPVPGLLTLVRTQVAGNVPNNCTPPIGSCS